MLTDAEVATRLRQAVRDRAIISWIHLPSDEWTVNSWGRGAHNQTADGIREFCLMLDEEEATKEPPRWFAGS